MPEPTANTERTEPVPQHSQPTDSLPQDSLPQDSLPQHSQPQHSLPTGSEPSAKGGSASRAGRRFGIGVFALVVGGITLSFTIQIITAAFSPVVTHPPAVAPGARDEGCAIAVAQLWEALQRARRSAADALTEQAALLVFREQLDPEWARLPEARGACEPDAGSAQGLAELIQLRFEEEHAVRFDARGLAVARARVGHWVRALGADTQAPARR